jgi:hypothetical protein
MTKKPVFVRIGAIAAWAVAASLAPQCSEVGTPKSPAPATAPANPPAWAPVTTAEPSTQADAVPTGAVVIGRFVEAVGGRQKWERFTSRRTTMSMSVAGISPLTGENAAAAAEMTVERKSPDRLNSMTKSADMGEIRQGYDGAVGWSIDPLNGPRVLTGSELHQLAVEATFNREIHLDRLYPVVERVESRDFRGQPSWRLQMKSPAGDTVVAYFEKASGLWVGFTRQFKAGDTLLSVTQAMSEYKDFDGLKFPTRIEQTVMETQQTMTVTSIEHVAIDDAVFALPVEIKTIVDQIKKTPAAESQPAAPVTP